MLRPKIAAGGKLFTIYLVLMFSIKALMQAKPFGKLLLRPLTYWSASRHLNSLRSLSCS